MAPQKPVTGIELEHFKLLWDYIKFHLGLYLATPAAFAFVATAFNVATSRVFFWTWCAMTFCCFVSGVGASWFMANRVNRRWNDKYDFDWEKDAASGFRRLVQHHLYWFALAVGFIGLAIAVWTK